jgi:phi13 family phage major tail protein
MANGRVITGYSKPFVALYANANGTVTYSGGIPLARGVEVQIAPEAADSTPFYADNTVAEQAGGGFSGGTVTLTVDGLKEAAQKLIMGLPAQTTISDVKWNDFGDAMSIPYVGVGFVVRYMEDGVTTYDAVVLTKVQFSVFGTDAATQEDAIEFQTQELEAAIMKDDTTAHNWKRVSEPQTTEAAAVAAYQAILTPAA